MKLTDRAYVIMAMIALLAINLWRARDASRLANNSDTVALLSIEHKQLLERANRKLDYIIGDKKLSDRLNKGELPQPKQGQSK